MTVQKLDRKRLIEVLSKNPDLPIMASVYSEVVADDGYAYWYGDVDEVYFLDDVWAGDTRIWSLDDALDDVILFINQEFPEKEPDTITPADEKKFEEFIKKLPWKKVIVLDVSTPDSLHGDD